MATSKPSAGYSGTPLAKKLGVKAGHRVALIGAPPGFVDCLAGLPEEVTICNSLRGKQVCDVIVFFARSEEELTAKFLNLAERLSTAGGLWIAWPKKASGVQTDVSEGVVRAIGLSSRLVDNKVCAIDETWSGLRFVRRLADRAD